jgi:hypothetical protein
MSKYIFKSNIMLFNEYELINHTYGNIPKIDRFFIIHHNNHNNIDNIDNIIINNENEYHNDIIQISIIIIICIISKIIY